MKVLLLTKRFSEFKEFKSQTNSVVTMMLSQEEEQENF